MKYIVVRDFKDLKDSGYIYRARDEFPRPNVNVDKNRIMELSTKNNIRGEILIKAVGEPAVERRRRKKNAGENTEGD